MMTCLTMKNFEYLTRNKKHWTLTLQRKMKQKPKTKKTRASDKHLQTLRNRISTIDERIVNLINERAKEVIKIGNVKQRLDSDFYHPGQEKEVYRRIREMSSGPISAPAMRAIYREIMSACLALEKELVIGYLGPPATFTHLAAISRFGASVEYLPVSNISDVFSEVETDHADYGVVPIENSTEGAINNTLDMFVTSNARICAEILLRISHCLLSKEKSKNKIKRIYSKAEVYGQCKIWLRANLPNAEFVETTSTTRAAEITADEKGAAAIASRLASQTYNLNIIKRSIEDIHSNVTRFLVISKNMAHKSKDDKTSIMFSTKDRVGSLHEILGVFRKYRINLSMIESRPSKKKAWDYYFFTDFDGHIIDKNISTAIKELEKKCGFVKILGSYPKSLEE